jgi:ectoine hydroxylase-related dioxygenase (phytanoyl-CoA dioxygenase family)
MPLTKLDAQTSRLKLLPGSHVLKGYERMQTNKEGDADLLPSGFNAANIKEKGLKWITVPIGMQAGDIILFNWKLIHSATKHTDAEHPRLSVDTRISLHAL